MSFRWYTCSGHCVTVRWLAEPLEGHRAGMADTVATAYHNVAVMPTVTQPPYAYGTREEEARRLHI